VQVNLRIGKEWNFHSVLPGNDNKTLQVILQSFKQPVTTSIITWNLELNREEANFEVKEQVQPIGGCNTKQSFVILG